MNLWMYFLLPRLFWQLKSSILTLKTKHHYSDLFVREVNVLRVHKLCLTNCNIK